ncbi:YaaC family protein [Burkholderia pseudomallei]|uniref:YaaC family protein n=1 Tax=Burkholderia pseudomallei TaxID=28450 RepID=UPI0005E3F6E3|nr:YaaC family protein [Burkholderia pseudomallei]MCW0031727.1 YaaC family protein [Burkholderia pseudomallei]MCW0084136.1 YaaC family protein [Burkholderia pseudomallei]MCW0091582.1 YaaC family protein [Burkholderia pseudomallei]MCW0108851.1 YaaC family protein [Burkholderia pseudomallei]MDY7761402.1 YaaC family protein [Burkholderia pseudomallei]
MQATHWEALRNYESYELIKRDYHERHGRTPSTAHAREISAPFAHARSYFMSARNADQTVKPLLLYYGVLSLSRGLTLALSRGRREATLAAAHGLSTLQWQNALSADSPDFGALRVAVNQSGSFSELGRATEFCSLLRANSSAINHKLENSAVTPEAEYSLGDIISRIPALRDHYKRWQGESACAQFSVEAAENPTEVIFNVKKAAYLPHVTREFCDELFLRSGCSFASESADNFTYRGTNDIDQNPGVTDFVGHFTIGDVWLTARYPAGENLSNILTVFTLAYTLGMLVRYFPTQWTALVRSQINDAALPSIVATIDWIETEYPRLVLGFLVEHKRVTPPR